MLFLLGDNRRWAAVTTAVTTDVTRAVTNYGVTTPRSDAICEFLLFSPFTVTVAVAVAVLGVAAVTTVTVAVTAATVLPEYRVSPKYPKRE